MRSTNHDDDNSKENIDSIWRKSWENECTNKSNLKGKNYFSYVQYVVFVSTANIFLKFYIAHSS